MSGEFGLAGGGEEHWGPAQSPPRCTVPNVTAHPSTASVPTSYYSMCTIIPCAH